MADAMASARDSLASRFTSRLGSLATLVESFAKGITAAGGDPLGGILAVVGELLTMSATFKGIVGMVNEVIQLAADALGSILIPMEPFIGAVTVVVQVVANALAPALEYMGHMLDPLVPIIVVLGTLLEGLSPVIAFLTEVMKLVQKPMILLANVGMRGLFEVLKYVGVAVLAIVKEIGGVWNGLLGAVQSVLRTLANISVFGTKPLAFLRDWAGELDAVRVPTEALGEQLANLSNLTWEAAQEKARETAEVLKNREALEKATESLSNVPNAWKVALARFNAQDARGTSPMAPLLTPSPAPLPAAPASAAPQVQPVQPAQQFIIDTINVSARDDYTAMSALQRKLDDMAFRAGGSRGRAGRYAYGD